MQTLEVEDVVGPMRRIELLGGLPDEALDRIGRTACWRRYDGGELVFDQGSDTLDVYFVVGGGVRILGGTHEREIALADLGAGEHFGELAAIDRKRRSARVVAQDGCVLASLEGAAFVEQIMRYPVIGIRLLQRFALIIRNLDSRLVDVSTLTEQQRIYGELVRLARVDQRGGGMLIPDMPNHKEIAAWAGTTREVVAQTLGELARMRVIERRSMAMMIRDWARLQMLAQGMVSAAVAESPQG